MKQITVISGKGGTGKTTITASFASLAERVVVADCDVEAANMHLLLSPQEVYKEEFKGSKIASIDEGKCIKCGVCEKLCRFDAIKAFQVDQILCEGCGVCEFYCPAKAITMNEKISGYVYVSKTRYGPLVYANLKAAESNSGKLVSVVRLHGRQEAEKGAYDLILIDGSPGIGCPVIASLTGVNLAVIVVEPTFSGIYDMKRILEVVYHFKIRPTVIINRYDLNIGNTEEIVEFCNLNNIDILSKVPFDVNVVKANVEGKPVIEYRRTCGASKEIYNAWRNIKKILSEAREK